MGKGKGFWHCRGRQTTQLSQCSSCTQSSSCLHEGTSPLREAARMLQSHHPQVTAAPAWFQAEQSCPEEPSHEGDNMVAVWSHCSDVVSYTVIENWNGGHWLCVWSCLIIHLTEFHFQAFGMFSCGLILAIECRTPVVHNQYKALIFFFFKMDSFDGPCQYLKHRKAHT